MPGIIDPHCHLGVNYPYNEDMRTETAAAASGGVTTVLLYIRNKSGPYVPFYKERRAVGEQNALIDFGFHFGIQREEHIHEIPRDREAKPASARSNAISATSRTIRSASCRRPTAGSMPPCAIW